MSTTCLETTTSRLLAFANATMVAVAASEQGYVVLGCVFAEMHHCTTVAWSSRDGFMSETPAVLPADGVAWGQGIISSPLGFLAWGSARSGINFWHTSGVIDAWQRATAIPSGMSYVSAVVWFEDRFHRDRRK